MGWHVCKRRMSNKIFEKFIYFGCSSEKAEHRWHQECFLLESFYSHAVSPTAHCNKFSFKVCASKNTKGPGTIPVQPLLAHCGCQQECNAALEHNIKWEALKQTQIE